MNILKKEKITMKIIQNIKKINNKYFVTILDKETGRDNYTETQIIYDMSHPILAEQFTKLLHDLSDVIEDNINFDYLYDIDWKVYNW